MKRRPTGRSARTTEQDREADFDERQEAKAAERARAAEVPKRVAPDRLVQTRVTKAVFDRLTRDAADAGADSLAAYLRQLLTSETRREGVDLRLSVSQQRELSRRARIDGLVEPAAWVRRCVLRGLDDVLVDTWAVGDEDTAAGALRKLRRPPDYLLRWLRDISWEQRVFILHRTDGTEYKPDALSADPTFTERRQLLLYGSTRRWRCDTLALGDRVELVCSPV